MNNIPNRKTRSDKKAKILCGLSNEDHDKLQMLAVSFGMTKTKLAEHMLQTCLNTESIADWYIKKFTLHDKYRVTLVKTRDGIDYI